MFYALRYEGKWAQYDGHGNLWVGFSHETRPTFFFEHEVNHKYWNLEPVCLYTGNPNTHIKLNKSECELVKFGEIK